jgi:hypothetical protein
VEPLTLVALALLAAKGVSTVKYALARDFASTSTQVLSWAFGVAVIALAAQADIAAGLDIAGTPLGQLDFPSQIFVGLSLGSAGSTVVDFRKAIDQSDSAREPALGGGPVPPAQAA